MPELPEVEITARLIDEAIHGACVESALAPGVNVMKTFDPPLSALAGERVQGVRRRGKHFIVDFGGGVSLLIHLMSAGRLQLFGKRAGPRDRTSRVLLRLADDGQRPQRELRLREFGSKQAAWAKLLRSDAVEHDPALATLGPEAWPDTPELGPLLQAARPLNALLRDQRTIAGIGRSWADEILWRAKLSPFKRGGDLDAGELRALRESIESTLGGALAHYERMLCLPIPDKLPMPLEVHAHEGQPCPRCGATLAAVHFDEHVIAYCPQCQTAGRKLKDRRLSRLLK
ncbi:MAG: DNA-formamidopyrimidine glycosylase family protein [Solirubrobacteraceae bacterium]